MFCTTMPPTNQNRSLLSFEAPLSTVLVGAGREAWEQTFTQSLIDTINPSVDLSPVAMGDVGTPDNPVLTAREAMAIARESGFDIKINAGGISWKNLQAWIAHKQYVVLQVSRGLRAGGALATFARDAVKVTVSALDPVTIFLGSIKVGQLAIAGVRGYRAGRAARAAGGAGTGIRAFGREFTKQTRSFGHDAKYLRRRSSGWANLVRESREEVAEGLVIDMILHQTIREPRNDRFQLDGLANAQVPPVSIRDSLIMAQFREIGKRNIVPGGLGLLVMTGLLAAQRAIPGAPQLEPGEQEP